MSHNAVLLLDFDGCVSPNTWQPETMPDTWSDWTLAEAHTFVSPLMLKALEALPATIATASSRGSDMAHLIAPHLTTPPLVACPDGYKLGEIHTFLAGLRPERIVWVDDDLATQTNQRALSIRHVFLLRPDPLIGITPSDIEGINEWLSTPNPPNVLIDRR